MNRIGFFILLFYFFVNGIDSKESGLKKNCQEEIYNLCDFSPISKKHSLLCLLEKENNLGTNCKSELSRLKEEMKTEMTNACGEDRNRFCFWVIPGGGRILKCLLETEEKLSPQCTSLISRFQK